MTETPRGEIPSGEIHPATISAANWIGRLGKEKLRRYLGALSSCAIESNRDAEICGETIRRILAGQHSIPDRYILGLAWYLRHIMEDKDE